MLLLKNKKPNETSNTEHQTRSEYEYAGTVVITTANIADTNKPIPDATQRQFMFHPRNFEPAAVSDRSC